MLTSTQDTPPSPDCSTHLREGTYAVASALLPRTVNALADVSPRGTESLEGGTMKAIIGTAVGILGLGGLVVAGSNRPAAAPATSVAIGERTAIASGQTLVDCGEGRQALVHPQPSGASRVECVATPAAQMTPDGMPYAQFASQYQAAPVQALPTIVQERVVYRDRPAARTTTARRTSRASAAPVVYTESAPVYRDEPKQTRSWKKSALIIGGATAGGAGVGAILDGKSGAKKGAVVGLVGGTVYDIATRNK